MPNFQFGFGLEGWTGTRREGTVTNPYLVWDNLQGYPALGSLRQDALDQDGVDNFDNYAALEMDVTTAPYDILDGQDISWFFRIQNRIAVERRFFINMTGGPSPDTFPEIDIPASSTSAWIKVTALNDGNDFGKTTVGFQIGTLNAGPGASYRYDGYYSVWVDNVFVAEYDPTPPPVTVTDYQPSTGGIPWLIKEDI